MRVNPCIGAHPTAAAAHRDPAIHLFLIIISIRPAFPCNGYWILGSLFLMAYQHIPIIIIMGDMFKY